jgi:acyl carrier protein
MKIEKIRGFLTEELQKRNFNNVSINDQTKFMENGLIDSLGFLELILKVEKEFNIQINFSEKDPSEYLFVGGFIKSIIETAKDI